MSYRVIKAILREELSRLRVLARRYRMEIAQLPRGSISLKNRGSRRYAYLVFRKDSKVRFKYLGPADSENVSIIAKKIRQRRQLEDKRKAVSDDLKKIERTARPRAV